MSDFLKIPGIDVNVQEGMAALILGADKGEILAVRAQLRAPGIEVNPKDKNCSTALI